MAASAELSPGRQETLGPNITVIADQEVDQETKQKRGARFDRPDNRRYHTAGTIEDLKVMLSIYVLGLLSPSFYCRRQIQKTPVFTSA